MMLTWHDEREFRYARANCEPSKKAEWKSPRPGMFNRNRAIRKMHAKSKLVVLKIGESQPLGTVPLVNSRPIFGAFQPYSLEITRGYIPDRKRDMWATNGCWIDEKYKHFIPSKAVSLTMVAMLDEHCIATRQCTTQTAALCETPCFQVLLGHFGEMSRREWPLGTIIFFETTMVEV